MKKLLFLLAFLSYSLSFAQVAKLQPDGKLKLSPQKPGSVFIIIGPGGEIFKNGVFDVSVEPGQTRLSAGVYDNRNGLVRTIVSGQDVTGLSTVKLQWDGFLDDGVTRAPFGNYTVKVLNNAVHYDWLGVIGNSSDSHISHEHLIGNGFYDLAVVGNYCYVALGYAERDITTKKFNINDIQKSIDVNPKQTTMSTFRVCTDGVNVYWSGINNSWSLDNGRQDRSFVFATKAADDTEYQFQNGSPETIDLTKDVYSSAILAKDDGTHGQPLSGGAAVASVWDVTGLAVQKTGNFLFVAYGQSNQLTVVNKTSGAIVQDITINGINQVKVNNADNLFIQMGNSIVLYTVGSDGTVNPAGTTIATNSNIAFAVSPATGYLSVADDATSQVKVYNGSTLVSTFGQLNGYDANGPLVTDNKFRFHSNRLQLPSTPVIGFQPDGKYWLFDTGNYRLIRFTGANSLVDKISYVPFCRSVNIDPNSPASMFADALEYQVDFSKVATDINSSWILKYNWSVNTDLNEYGQFEQVVTLFNGHKYGLGTGNTSPTKTLYDLLLPNGAVPVVTGLTDNLVLEQDGSLWNRTMDNDGFAVITKKSLTNFTVNGDGSQTPNWGTYTNVVSTPGFATNPDQPVYYINNTFGSSTNASKYFFFDQFINAPFPNSSGQTISTGNGYHLGAIPIGSNKWSWQTSKTSPSSYQGIFPDNGWFDYTGQSNNCRTDVNGSNIFWHVNSELGRFTQTTWTNHFNENGLFVGQFGTDNTRVGFTGDTRYWAGNSFKTQLAKFENDLYYVYADESKHSGIHLIKVSNLTSVKTQAIPILVTGAVSPLSDATNLMSGLPFRGATFGSAAGWYKTGNPTIKTTVQQFLPFKNDIQISGNSGDRQVSRFLSGDQLSSYTLSGNVCYTGSQFTFNDFNVNNTLSLLDQSGKQIAFIYSKDTGIYLNNTRIAPYNAADQNLFRSFSYNYSGGVLTFKFGSYPAIQVNPVYETGADISRPGKLLINQHVVGGRNDYTQLDLFGLRFVPGAEILQ